MQALVPLDMHCTQEARNLGMILDSDLNASSHFHYTTQMAMCQLRVRSFLSFQVTKFLIHTFICSQLDCCVFIWKVLWIWSCFDNPKSDLWIYGILFSISVSSLKCIAVNRVKLRVICKETYIQFAVWEACMRNTVEGFVCSVTHLTMTFL